MSVLAGFGPFWSTTTTVLMVAAIVVTAVAVPSFIRVIIVVASRAVSARILVAVDFNFFGVNILINGGDHLTNPLRRLAIEFGAEVTVMESLDESRSHHRLRTRTPSP